MTEGAPQPLAGLRVLDLTHVLAGPFCTYQLAVLGADVIKVEPVDRPDMVREEGPDTARNSRGMGTHYMAQNANKRALAVDLKSEEGKEILLALISGADVLVENYRGGVLDGLSLCYDRLHDVNPRLVICHVSGFGMAGKDANRPAYDNVIQAMSGIMAMTGTPEAAPLIVGAPVVDYATGLQGAFAVMAALRQRDVTNKGQIVDVSMLDAAMMLLTVNITNFLVGCAEPNPRGNLDIENPGYSCYETADGLLMLGAYTGRQQAVLWRLLGDEDRADAVAALSFDGLRERGREDREKLAAIFKTRTAAQWEEDLTRAGIAAARVRSMKEVLNERSGKLSGLLHTFAEPGTGGRVTLPVAAFSFDGGPRLTSPPPRHGEHTTDILRELGMSTATISDLAKRGIVAEAPPKN